MNIQWYPGHMTKARRAMTEDLKLVSLVIEIADARLPLGSRNPDIDKMAANKDRLILLNKADLADEQLVKQWIEWYGKRGIRAVPLDSRVTKDVRRMRAVIMDVSRERIERNRRRGILNKPIRAMVAGIPNVGKSTFINSIAGKTAAKTGNKPGVTRSDQWIRLDKTLELLDTPGILWPKFDDNLVSRNLAFLGAISDDVLPQAELVLELIKYMRRAYPDTFRAWLKTELTEEMDAPSLLTEEARARGCLKAGAELDYDRAAALFLTDFRAGRMGHVTLEIPPEESIWHCEN